MPMQQQVANPQFQEMMMAMVGLETLAYIKPVLVGASTQYAVFAADGTQLAIFDKQETAYYNVVKHNLSPSSIH